MTRRQLARRLGLSYAAVSRWTTDTPRGRKPTASNLSRLVALIDSPTERMAVEHWHSVYKQNDWAVKLRDQLEYGTWKGVPVEAFGSASLLSSSEVL